MFGLVRLKTVKKEAVDIYLRNDNEKPGERDFYFACGSASALGALCSRLGINLANAVKEAKEKVS